MTPKWRVSGDEEQLLGALANGLADAVSTPPVAPPHSSVRLWCTRLRLERKTDFSSMQNTTLYAYLLLMLATSMIAAAMTWLRYRGDVSVVMGGGTLPIPPHRKLAASSPRVQSRHHSPKPSTAKKED